MDPTTRARILAHIDAHQDELVASLQTMIRIPSVNPAFDPTSAGEAAMADHVAQRYAALGIPVERVEPAPGRSTVIATVEGNAPGPKLLVNCHLDTVPADVGEWYDPFTGVPSWPCAARPFGGDIVAGKMYGRGAADHKSPIAALLAALEALSAEGITLAGRLTCIHDADEETGGELGMQYLADTSPFDYDMVLYACSSEFTPLGREFFDAMGDDNVIRVLAGWHTYRIRVTGYDIHNLTPRRALGGVEAAIVLLEHLKALADRVNAVRNPLEGSGQPIMRISDIECSPRSAVHRQARWCDIVVNRRLSPGVTSEVALAEIEAEITRYNRDNPGNPATLELLRDQRAFETPADHPVVTGLARAVDHVTGRSPTITGLPAPVGISAMLNRHPLPTVLFGYGYLNMHHAPNEHIEITSLTKMAKVYALALVEWLGVADATSSA